MQFVTNMKIVEYQKQKIKEEKWEKLKSNGQKKRVKERFPLEEKRE